MGINLTEISQKVLDTVGNAANVFRKMYDLHYNPDPLDVELEYIDENGNKRTARVPNRSKIAGDFERWKQTVHLKFPIQPNLFLNTKTFEWANHGKATFYQNELPDHWGWHNYNGGDTNFKAMVIDAVDSATLSALGIPNPLDQIPLCDEYGNDVSILYIELNKSAGETVFFEQDVHRYTAWSKGNFISGMKAYTCVIDGSGDIKVNVSGNRYAPLGLDLSEKGNGWIHKTSHRNGFGGFVQGNVSGSGSIKFAIALPYAYVGFLDPSIHAWAGAIYGQAPYTHQDIQA